LPRRHKLHDDEVDIDADLVERLIASQFPRLAGMSIRPVPSMGTVNAIYRVGGEHYARLPRTPRWAADLERECQWLPYLAPHLTLRIPEPLAMGEPLDGYAFRWAVYRWIDGAPYDDRLIADERDAARTLSEFVRELRSVPPLPDAPRAGRRPLRELDAMTRDALESARDVIDCAAALTAWDRALETPAWSGEPVWIHADLLMPNLLVNAGRLAAVIDFGSAGIGDPAHDVIPAWSVFGSAGRDAFRRTLDVDDGTWSRARGIALHQAAIAIPYYVETNSGFAALAKRTVEQVVSD